MHRIDTDTKSVDLFGSGKHGYTEGDPATGTAATRTSADHVNALQEELANTIETAGLTLAKSDNTQLIEAIRAIADTNVAISNYFPYKLPHTGEGRLLHLATNAAADTIVGVGESDGTNSAVQVSNPLIANTMTGHNVWSGSSVTFSVNRNYRLNRVIYVDSFGLWVAVGGSAAAYSYCVSSNAPAALWTDRTSAETDELFGLAYSPTLGMLISCGGVSGASSALQRSTNGTSWTSNTTAMADVIRYIVWDATNGYFVGGGEPDGSNFANVKSSNGTSWSSNAAAVTYYGIAYSPKHGGVFAIRDDDVDFSVDGGSVWSEKASGVFNSTIRRATDLYWSTYHNVLVATGLFGVATSPDGVTWTFQSIHDNSAIALNSTGVGSEVRGPVAVARSIFCAWDQSSAAADLNDSYVIRSLAANFV